MKILFVGGTGQISLPCVELAVQDGHQVSVFNRGQRGDPPPADVRVIQGDRRDRPGFEAALQAHSFDAAIDMISFNADDAASALRALRGRIGHFIHCSTVMTYGPPFTGLFQDESAPLNGRNDGGYGAGKVAAEELLLSAHAADGFPVTVVKPSFTYGPGGNLLRQAAWSSEWIDRLRKRKPLLSVGDGLNYFQFLPAPDAGAAFADLVGKLAAIGQVYNLVHPEYLTWDQWHRAVADALGVEAEIVNAPQELLMAVSPERYGHLSSNFGHTQVFSGAKLSELLRDWQPRTPRRDAIAATIEWMDRNGRVANSDDDTLEDRIIAAMRALPTSLSTS